MPIFTHVHCMAIPHSLADEPCQPRLTAFWSSYCVSYFVASRSTVFLQSLLLVLINPRALFNAAHELVFDGDLPIMAVQCRGVFIHSTPMKSLVLLERILKYMACYLKYVCPSLLCRNDKSLRYSSPTNAVQSQFELIWPKMFTLRLMFAPYANQCLHLNPWPRPFHM